MKYWPPSSGRSSRNKPDEHGAELTHAYAAARRPRERRPAGYSISGAPLLLWGTKGRHLYRGARALLGLELGEGIGGLEKVRASPEGRR